MKIYLTVTEAPAKEYTTFKPLLKDITILSDDEKAILLNLWNANDQRVASIWNSYRVVKSYEEIQDSLSILARVCSIQADMEKSEQPQDDYDSLVTEGEESEEEEEEEEEPEIEINMNPPQDEQAKNVFL